VIPDRIDQEATFKILICGGIAGIATWASIFPLDVIKTRLQGQPLIQRGTGVLSEHQSLLGHIKSNQQRKGSIEIAREAYRTEGLKVFYRGFGICSVRAFIVNAVQV
jgi:solute carrier family 25 (mitochondrial carnitine/acylcarnitine transporter), member 20/29